MAVNFTVFEDFKAVSGVRLGVAKSHVRYADRDDMVVIELAEGTEVAGVFTTNAFCAAPVQICKHHLGIKAPRYLLINTGNANAGTGKSGYANAVKSCELMAAAGQCTCPAGTTAAPAAAPAPAHHKEAVSRQPVAPRALPARPLRAANARPPVAT